MARYWLPDLSLSFFLTCAIACKSVPSSDLSHEVGTIVQVKPAYVWQSISYQEAVKSLGVDGKVLPAEAVLSRHIQAIADAIDTRIRQTYPEVSRDIPRPTIIPYISDEMNGYNGDVDLYIRQKARKKDRSISGKDRVADLNNPGFIIEASRPTDANGTPFLMVDNPATLKGWNTEQFVSLWNQKLPQNSKNCSIALAKDGVIETSLLPACNAMNNGEAELIKIRAHSNFIFLSSSLLKMASEKELTSFLAHELGHYYQGHVSSVGHSPSYFYLQTAANELRRPAMTSEFPQLQKRLIDAMDLFIKTKPLVGAQFSPNVFPALKGLFLDLKEDICSAGRSCSDSFVDLQKFYDEKVYFSVFVILDSGGSLTDEGQQDLISFEKKLMALLKRISLADLRSSSFPTIQSELETYGLTRSFGSMPDPKNLVSWIASADKRVLAVIKAEVGAMDEAALVGLGYYTDEEVADETATEIASFMGLNKAQVSAVWWLQLEDDDQKKVVSPDALSLASCRDLQAKNWKAVNGEAYPRILLGKLSDSHHSFCYRIFNIEREWEVHSYDKAAKAPQLFAFDEAKWKVLQSDLAKTESQSSDSSPESGAKESAAINRFRK